MTGGFAADIGGSKIAVTALSADAPVVRAVTDSTDPAAIVAQVVDLVHRAGVVGGGGVVATPGAVDGPRGVVRTASNLPFRDFPLGPRLADALGEPVTIVVDTAAAAIAEFAAGGAAAGRRTGAYVTVSTGIGMAMIVDGRLHAGARFDAGELGHVPVAVGDVALSCPCGQRGCLEAYASGSGLARRAEMHAAAGHTAADIVRVAGAGTTWAHELLDDALTRLAVVLAGVIRVIDPEALVLGGGLLVHAGLFDPVRERIVELLRATVPDVATIVRPAAFGDLSPLRGAVALARRDPDALRLARVDGRQSCS